MAETFKVVGTDNLCRESVADKLLVDGIPDTVPNRYKAREFCDWLNTFTTDADGSGTYYVIKEGDYRLSRGMEDLV